MALLGAAPSCTAASAEHREHIVMFNEEGRPVDPAHNPYGRVLPYEELERPLEEYVEEHVLTGLERGPWTIPGGSSSSSTAG